MSFIDPPHHTLGHDKCIALLASAQMAHVALSDRALPHIVPVDMRLIGGDIFVYAPGEALLRYAARGDVVCLQADSWAPPPLWSVTVTGRIELISDANALNDSHHPLLVGSEPVSGPLIRLRTQMMTGQRWRGTS